MAGHIGLDQWVAHRFYFRVTVDGTQLSVQEVTGLETTNKVIEYRHCDAEEFIVTKRIGMTETSTLKLEKGLFTDDSFMLDKFGQTWDKDYMSTTAGRFDVLVELLDELGDAIYVWNFHNCIITKLAHNGLKSDASEASMESLEIAYDKMVTSL